MADDDEPVSGEDPWADLEAEGLPDLEGDFSFSLDDELSDATLDQPATDESASEEQPARSEEPAPDEPGPADPVSAAAQDDNLSGADIDAWLENEAEVEQVGSAGEPDAEASLSGVHDTAGDDAVAGPAGGSSIDIGTGNSGIPSPSSIEAFGSSAIGEDAFQEVLADSGDAGEADPFSAIPEEAAAEDHPADPFAAEAGGIAAAAAAAGFAVTGEGEASGLPEAAEAEDAPAEFPSAPRKPRPKKSGQVGQMIGVIAGGVLAIPIVLAILIWGFGRDPFQLTPLVPESLAFLLPASLQPGGGSAGELSLAAALADAEVVTEEAAAGPAATEPATEEPATEEPATEELATEELATALAMEELASEELASEADLLEPEPTDLVVLEPAEPAALGNDPLTAMIDAAEEEPVAIVPPALALEPEPEPLDLTGLEERIAGVLAALDAVAAVPEDPANPDDKVRRRRLAACYRALTGYAEELAALEELAVASARPFGPAAEQAALVRRSLADHPDVISLLPLLSRDWFNYSKRSGDGVVTAGTLVDTRPLGPSWRSRLACTLPGLASAIEIIVLSRTEPAVVPGELAVVAGLAVDETVVWAADIAAAPAAAAAEPAAVDIFGSPGL